MGDVAQLWNSRSKHSLRRHWVSFRDRIVIGGEYLDQTGVLTVRRVHQDELRARLRVMGREFEEVIKVGNDIAVWINGLELVVGVKAVDGERMLAAFGIQPGSGVCVSLEQVEDENIDAEMYSSESGNYYHDDYGHSIGLRQIRL